MRAFGGQRAVEGLLSCLLAAIIVLHSSAPALAAPPADPYGVAVIVGNRNYTHEDRRGRTLPAVEFAHRDAAAFKRYVIDVLGYAPENVIELSDATKAEMEAAFGNANNYQGRLWQFIHPKRGADVVVFYSGHGVPGLKDKRGYLLPSNADPNNPEINGYPLDLLYENLGKLKAAKLVRVYLDACFSGDSDQGMLLSSASPSYVSVPLPESVGDRFSVLTAASGEEVASWDERAGHGLFTHHLLDALYGKGDEDGDGKVTAREAKAWLDDHMTYAAQRRFGRVQNATLSGEAGLVLAHAGAGGAFPERRMLEALPQPNAGAAARGEASRNDGSDRSASPPVSDLASLTGGNAILTVVTDPPGATVSVDGVELGATPLERYDLYAGVRTVVLNHATHETVVLENQSLVDRRVLSIDRRLKPATGAVTVLAWPRDAWIEHGGSRLADSTPVTLEGLPSGPLTLMLGAAEHRSLPVEVMVPKGDVVLVKPVLEKIDYGTLTLELDPADARVTLPDGDAPYRAGMRLAEGEHRVGVASPGYRETTHVVTVSGDTHARIALKPEPQPFTIVAAPASAGIDFLGRSDGYRPGIALFPGTYRVRVSAEGWETQEVTIRHGRVPTRHKVTLKRSWDPVADEAALGLERSEKKLVQQGLAAAGHSPGTPDGLFGDNTRKALSVWQTAQGHEATGYLAADQAKALIAAGREAAKRSLRPGREFRDCNECPEMVVVPAGSFTMGSPSSEKGRSSDEGPQRVVTIPRPFAVGKYEVTFEEWDACVRGGGCPHRPGDKGWGRGRRPVISVSWKDAQDYVRWLSRETGKEYRLLTEAEWEYAARAGTTEPFHFGETISKSQARYDSSSTVPVGGFPANAFGLHDMHGNVWEWVEDCWHGSYNGAPSDRSAWTSGGNCGRRVLRGGSWSNLPGNLRSANRNRVGTGVRNYYIGFRISRTLAP